VLKIISMLIYLYETNNEDKQICLWKTGRQKTRFTGGAKRVFTASEINPGAQSTNEKMGVITHRAGVCGLLQIRPQNEMGC